LFVRNGPTRIPTPTQQEEEIAARIAFLEEQLAETRHELRERTKELSCLYGISRFIEDAGHSLDHILQGIVDLLPPSCLYPDIACARIILRDKSYQTTRFALSPWCRQAVIACHGQIVGRLEVAYLEVPPDGKDPFLPNEVELFRAIAERVGRVVDRIETETQLRETSDYLEKLLSHANAPIVVWNPRLEITRCNLAFERLTGYDASEILGRKLAMCFPEDSCAESMAKIASTHNRALDSVEIPVLHKDGDVRLVIWSSASIDGPDGATPVATIAQGTDITDRVKAEDLARRRHEELAQVLRLNTVGEMASGIAHELNQPLGAICAYVDALDEMEEPARAAEYGNVLDKIAQQARRASLIVERIRQFLRKQTGTKSRISVNDTIREAIGLIHHEFMRAGANVRLELAEPLPAVLGNPVDLQQVFVNLGRNAIEAMRASDNDERSLTVSSREQRDDGEVLVSFRDTGCGIECVAAGHIFEPFYTTKPDGMGLGLMICRTVVENHGGRLLFTPNQGRGTTFQLTLPVGGEGRGGQ
jgi:PAS domain S-box-containing protein